MSLATNLVTILASLAALLGVIWRVSKAIIGRLAEIESHTRQITDNTFRLSRMEAKVNAVPEATARRTVDKLQNGGA